MASGYFDNGEFGCTGKTKICCKCNFNRMIEEEEMSDKTWLMIVSYIKMEIGVCFPIRCPNLHPNLIR